MNTQSLDLNKMGLAPMQSSEMQEVEGGSLLGKIAILVGGVLAVTGVATGVGLVLIAACGIEDAVNPSSGGGN